MSGDGIPGGDNPNPDVTSSDTPDGSDSPGNDTSGDSSNVEAVTPAAGGASEVEPDDGGAGYAASSGYATSGGEAGEGMLGAEGAPEAKLEWYFLRVQVGREDRIRENMVRRLKQNGLEEHVPQLVVPTETIADHRAGKKTVKRRKLYPGYLMVQMKLNDDVWFVLRETPGFGDFVGGHAQPTPAKAEDVEKVLATMDASKEQPKVAVQYKKGDRVKIKTGAFENTDATVEEVHPDKGTLDVSVNFFGRPTPLSLGYWEVEPI